MKRVFESVVYVTGHNALEPAGRTFYMYITEKSGVFNAMLRYDKFHSDKMQDAAKRFFYLYDFFFAENFTGKL